MTRIADIAGLAGVIAVLACDATSPIKPAAQAATPFTPSVAFESDRDGAPYVYVAKRDGGGVTRLVPGKAPAWSRDGSRIAYYFGGDNGYEEAGIYVTDAGGSYERWLAPAQDLAGQGASWGPGDREIAFRGDGGIFAVAINGSTPPRKLIGDDLALPRPKGWNAGDHDPGWVESPAWSPDGNHIAFLRVDPIEGNGGQDRNMYVIDADGSNPRLLGPWCGVPPPGSGTLPCQVTSFAWSPSGQTLAVVYYDVNAETGGLDVLLGVMPASLDSDSSNVMAILYRGSAAYLGDTQWSPDGSAITFDTSIDTTSDGSRGPSIRILLLSLDTRVVQQLIPDAANPALTPYVDEHAVWRQVP